MKTKKKYHKYSKKLKKNKKIQKKTRRHQKTRKQYGGISREQENINNFRTVFMTRLAALNTAISNNNNQTQITDATNAFNRFFVSNKTYINTLIPVADNYEPIDKSQGNVRGFVPLLAIVMKKITDPNIKSKIIKSFKKNTGNINLKSIRGDITALSTAIENNDTESTILLRRMGADENTLTDEQKHLLDSLLQQHINARETTTTDIEPIIQESQPLPVTQEIATIPETSTLSNVKLDVRLELPAEHYNPDIEPEFWKPIFATNEMFELRERIRSMMVNDLTIGFSNGTMSDIWSLCRINKTIIPTYYVPTKNEPYMVFDRLVADHPTDFSQYNIILCASLLLLGVISFKLSNQDYQLIFKGGKAIQLVLSGISESETYKTEDIDVLVAPKKDISYDQSIVQNIAGHVAYLVQWFLNFDKFDISVMSPNPSNPKSNPFIYKLSYIKFSPKSFKQFSDIDFKEIPEILKEYFEKSTVEYEFDISELGEKVLFRCPNIGAIIDEKLYYYIKYFRFKKMLESGLKIDEEGYERLDVEECTRILDKFKRAIKALNQGLQKQRSTKELTRDELISKEKSFINNRLTQKLEVTNPTEREEIISNLYSN